MRRLHCSKAVVDDADGLDEDVEAVDGDVDVPAEGLVVSPGVVVVVGSESVADVLVAGVVDTSPPPVVVVSEGATATGVSPTWESARPTICQARTVATTRAATQAADMRQEIMT